MSDEQGDEPILYQIMRDAHVPHVARMSRDWIERGLGWSWRASRIWRNIQRPDTSAIVALDKTQVVGFLIVRHQADVAHVLLCAVDPSMRRRGVGRGLFAWFEPVWQMMQVRQVVLELRQTNSAALHFYESMGFEAYARVRGYYQRREDAIKMRRRRDVEAVRAGFDVFGWLSDRDTH